MNMDPNLGWAPFAEQLPGITGIFDGCYDRVAIVYHIADGHEAGLRNIADWNARGVSAHFVILKDGRILQYLNLFDSAWHAGVVSNPTWPYLAQLQSELGTGNPNRYTVGIEHEGFSGDAWTPEQQYADNLLTQWIRNEVQAAGVGWDVLRFGPDSLVRHSTINDQHGGCPGSGWDAGLLWTALQQPVPPAPTPPVPPPVPPTPPPPVPPPPGPPVPPTPPPTPPEGDEMYTPLFAESAWFDDPAHEPFSAPIGANIHGDFPALPADVTDVAVEVCLFLGSSAVTVLHGQPPLPAANDAYAGRVPASSLCQIVRVRTTPDGWWTLRPEGNARIRWLRLLGYYQ